MAWNFIASVKQRRCSVMLRTFLLYKILIFTPRFVQRGVNFLEPRVTSFYV